MELGGVMNMMFGIVPIFIVIVFVIIIVTMISRGANYGAQKAKPEQTVGAKVLTKRQHVWGDHSRTSYYATFELEDGRRMEFLIPKNKIGYIVEGDAGALTHQGTLFVEFTRHMVDKYGEDRY